MQGDGEMEHADYQAQCEAEADSQPEKHKIKLYKRKLVFDISSHNFGNLVETQRLFEVLMNKLQKAQNKAGAVKEEVVWTKYSSEDLGWEEVEK